MPNVMTVLKDEIVRLARKEVRGTTEPLRGSVAAVRKSLSDLSKRVSVLERELKRLAAGSAASSAEVPTVDEEAPKARITAKGVRSLRKKLGLTRKAFGALLGVSEQNIYLWERKEGPLRVREATRRAILDVRDIGTREAQARLAASDAKASSEAKASE